MNVLWLCIGILLSSDVQAQSSQSYPYLFRTSWLKHYGLEPGYLPDVSPEPTLHRVVRRSCGGSVHGDPCEYDDAGPSPAADHVDWRVAPDPVTINQQIWSVLFNGTGRASPTCFELLDFTYFQTYVYVAPSAQITNLTVAFAGMEDGVRVSVINGNYPSGVVSPGGHVPGGGASTDDLAPYLSAGLNRLLLTHVDDCAPFNVIESAAVVANGHPLDTITCADGVHNGDETGVDVGGSCAAAGGVPGPKHCEWSQWSGWGQCSVYCGGGLQSRTRFKAQEAVMGGTECVGFSEEVQSCNTAVCPKCGDAITDADGHAYRTVAVGGQCWMRDNLNTSTLPNGTAIAGRRCGPRGGGPYAHYNAYCARGAFYTWGAAMLGDVDHYPRPTRPTVAGICPGGPMNWHIPSVEEWDALLAALQNFPSKRLQDAGNRCVGVACHRLGGAGLDVQLLGYVSEYANVTAAEFDVNAHSYHWSASRKYRFQAGDKASVSDDQVHVFKLRYDHHLVPWVTHTKGDFLSVRCVSGDVSQ